MSDANAVDTVLTLDTTQHDAAMKKSEATVTSSQKMMAKAAKESAEAQAFAAKFAGDAAEEQTLRIITAQKQQLAAAADLREAQRLARVGYGGEEESVRLVAAAMQRLTAAKLETAAASATQTVAQHATVSEMQATSAAVRSLEGNAGIRSVERLLTTIPGVGAALRVAFPLIGGIAFGSMIVDLGEKIAEFIKKSNEMPNAIRLGFDALHLSALASNDALRLTNDELQNHINKLQGKPQNNLAIQLDEARIKADDLAKSLQEDANRVKELLAANMITEKMAFFGNASTSSVSGSINSWMQQLSDLGYQRNQRVHSGDTTGAAELDSQIAALRQKALAWASDQLTVRSNLPEIERHATAAPSIGGGIAYNGKIYQDIAGDQTGNRNVLQGFTGMIQDSLERENSKSANANLVPQGKAAEVAAEARRKQAEEFGESLRINGELLKQALALAEDLQKFTVSYTNDLFRSQGLSSDDNKDLDRAGTASLARITALNQGIELSKKNSDALAESSIQMALSTEQINKLDAARAVAALHQRQYAEAAQELDRQWSVIAADPTYINEEARQADAQDNINRRSALDASHTIQAATDRQATNPIASSAVVGATNALNEFTLAAQNSARQLSEVIGKTLSGINDNIIKSAFGERTNFRGVGLNLAKQGAGSLLDRAEGSAISLITGKPAGTLGTKASPMYVRDVDSSTHAKAIAAGDALGLSGNGGLLGKLNDSNFASSLFGGKLFGFGSIFGGPAQGGSSGDSSGSGSLIGGIGSTVVSAISRFFRGPHASGGYAAGGGFALVGEAGPELIPTGSGINVIPNSQIGGVVHHHQYNIDARGQANPAATQAAVGRALVTHSVTMSSHVEHQRRLRTPQKR